MPSPLLYAGLLALATVVGEPLGDDVPPSDDPVSDDSNGDATDSNDADEPATPTIVLVSGTGSDPERLEARIHRTRAELRAAGLQVLEISLTRDDASIDAEQLRELAAADDANVVLRFDPESFRAELWMREDGLLQRRSIIVGDGLGEDADAVFAIRIAEVLQASLIEVELSPRPLPKPTPPPEPTPPPTPAPPPPFRPRWGARLGLHVLASGGLGPMLGPTLGGTLWLTERRSFGIDVEAHATALEGRLASTAGSARVGYGIARALAQWWPVPEARISPGLGGGGGVLVAWTRGFGEGPYVGRVDVTTVALPTVAADLSLRLTRRLRVRLGVRASVALPGIEVITPVGSARGGQPLIDGGAALEFGG